MPNDIPPWLGPALADVESPVAYVVRDEGLHDLVAPGEIRLAIPTTENETKPRLVLVLEVSWSPDPWASVCLVTDVLEARGENDLVLRRAETGLRFEVVVE